VSQFLITTKERVKAKRDITGTTLDAVIDTLIAGVSQMAEEHLGRRLLSDLRTEVRPLQPRTRYVSLLGFPIESVTSVQYGSTRDFADVAPMDPSEFQALLPQGQIYLSSLSTWLSPGFVQIIYEGGMANDTASFIAAYPRIAEAADSEVIARLNRRQSPDGSPSALGTNVMYSDELKPLTDFYAALDPHRRLRL
jgi:hypothetical protein